ncbi:MAG: hypothetical protein ACREGI_05990 [Candidatus Levyibacteriota bacterium]
MNPQAPETWTDIQEVIRRLQEQAIVRGHRKQEERKSPGEVQAEQQDAARKRQGKRNSDITRGNNLAATYRADPARFSATDKAELARLVRQYREIKVDLYDLTSPLTDPNLQRIEQTVNRTLLSYDYDFTSRPVGDILVTARTEINAAVAPAAEKALLLNEVDSLSLKYTEIEGRGGIPGVQYLRYQFTDAEIRAALEIDPVLVVARGQDAAIEAMHESQERIFSELMRKASALPNVQFDEAFSQLTDYPVYKEFGDLLTAKGFVQEAQIFGTEFQMVKALHNANFAVATGVNLKDLSGYMKSVLAGYADLAFSRFGVQEAMHFMELAMRKVMTIRGGMLLAKDMGPDPTTKSPSLVQQLARDMFVEAVRQGAIRDGNGVVLRPDQVEDWKVDRALSYARGLMVFTGRNLEIAAESTLPLPLPGQEGGTYVSLYAHGLLAAMAPNRHLFSKLKNFPLKNMVLLNYAMGKGKGPWSYKDLKALVDESGPGGQDRGWIRAMFIANGMTDGAVDSFLSVLNPFEIGGLFSRTGWRYSEHPLLSAFAGLNDREKELLGTGFKIEFLRGGLQKGDRAARAKIEELLRRTAAINPLRLYNQLGPKFTERVLREIAALPAGQRIIIDPLETRARGSIDDLDLIAILQEKAVEKLLAGRGAVPRSNMLDLDFASIADPAQRMRIQRFVEIIRRQFLATPNAKGMTEIESFITNLKNKDYKLPFAFGTDDVPYKLLRFRNTGETSLARRWGDVEGAAQAQEGLLELLQKIQTYQSPDQIMEPLRKIYEGLKINDEGLAKRLMPNFAKGIIRFYQKAWWARLPLGVGTFLGKFGKTSYAQWAYGITQPAWTELDIDAFTRKLWTNGIIEEDKMKILNKEVGAGMMGKTWAIVRMALPLLLLAISIYITSKALRDDK